MDKIPSVSVIMPVYNAERYVEEAIKSILDQTYADFEFIIINDGSTDKSEEIIKSFFDKRIHLITQKNKGVIEALNAGLEVAQGTYIARMDADDISEPTRLEKQVAFMQKNPNIALCGTWAKTIDQSGTETGVYNYPPTTPAQIRKAIIRYNPFIHPSVLFTKKAIKTVGAYSKNFKHTEDYELWTRFVAKYQTANLNEYLLRYRITSGSITQKNKWAMTQKGISVRLLAFARIWLKIPA